MDDLSRRQRTGGPSRRHGRRAWPRHGDTRAGGWPGAGDCVVGADVARRPSAPARDTGPRPESSGKEPPGDRREDNSRRGAQAGGPHWPRGRTGRGAARPAYRLPWPRRRSHRVRTKPRAFALRQASPAAVSPVPGSAGGLGRRVTGQSAGGGGDRYEGNRARTGGRRRCLITDAIMNGTEEDGGQAGRGRPRRRRPDSAPQAAPAPPGPGHPSPHSRRL